MADPVFAAFCAAGLWPGLGTTLAGRLAEFGVESPDDVTVAKLVELPQVGRVRAERLLSSWIGAHPTYDVAGLLVPAGLPALLADRVADPGGALAAALETGTVLEVGDGQVALDRYAMAEDSIAEAVARLAATAKPLGEPADLAEFGAELDQTQRAAVAQVVTAGVSVLTGCSARRA